VAATSTYSSKGIFVAATSRQTMLAVHAINEFIFKYNAYYMITIIHRLSINISMTPSLPNLKPFSACAQFFRHPA
jgi:hypothetical protein